MAVIAATARPIFTQAWAFQQAVGLRALSRDARTRELLATASSPSGKRRYPLGELAARDGGRTRSRVKREN